MQSLYDHSKIFLAIPWLSYLATVNYAKNTGQSPNFVDNFAHSKYLLVIDDEGLVVNQFLAGFKAYTA
jgi:hypothetical protein